MHSITFFGWSLVFGVVAGGSFHLFHNPFYSTLLYSIHFSLPVTVCFKNRMISLHLCRESHVEIWSRRFYFHLNYIEPKHKSNEHNHTGANDFQSLIGYLGYVGYFPCGIILIVLVNVSIWSLSTSIGLPNYWALSSEKYPAQNFANYFWHVWPVTAPSRILH